MAPSTLFLAELNELIEEFLRASTAYSDNGHAFPFDEMERLVDSLHASGEWLVNHADKDADDPALDRQLLECEMNVLRLQWELDRLSEEFAAQCGSPNLQRENKVWTVPAATD